MKQSNPDDLSQEYLDYMKHVRNSSPHTLDSYAKDIGQWFLFLEKEQISWNEAQPENLYAFLSGEFITGAGKKIKLTRVSQARKFSSVKAFYRYCERADILPLSPVKHAKAARYKRGLPRPLRPGEMESLLENETEQKVNIQLRDKALWELSYSGGLRISEALSLNFDSVYSNGEFIPDVVIRGKGGKERLVFLGQKCISALEKYFPVRSKWCGTKPVKALFLNMRGLPLSRRGAAYILRMRSARLGISDKITPHSLRHSFATDLLNEGANIRHVQEMLGHSRISTTQNYTQVTKERLMDVYRRSHPHAVDKSET